MKATSAIQFLLPLLLAGCASSSLYLTPRLAPALAAAKLDFPIKQFSARTNKGILEVEVRAGREDRDYRGNFDLELASAAAVCAALARSDAPFEYDWREMDLTFWNEYGNMLRWRNTVGFLKVRMPRQTLQSLRERNVPSSEYPRHWHLLAGSKAGPGSELLEWREGESQPGRDRRIEQPR